MDNNFLKIIVVVVVTLGAMSFLATMNQPESVHEAKTEVVK